MTKFLYVQKKLDNVFRILYEILDHEDGPETAKDWFFCLTIWHDQDHDGTCLRVFFCLPVWHDQDYNGTCLHVFLRLQNQHPLRMKILRGMVKYSHNTYERRTQQIPSEDTIVLLPEEKADICQRDSKCWRVLGACTYIVIDYRVTRIGNAFDCGSARIGKITFLRTFPFWKLTIELHDNYC